MNTCIVFLALMAFRAFETPIQQTVFLEGEEMRLLAPDRSTRWQALRDDLSVAASGTVKTGEGTIATGALPVGWYRFEFYDVSDAPLKHTTIAVLKALRERPPADTPVALDMALSWVPEPREEVWRSCARLAALAGVSMVRDRLRWRDLQPEPGPLLPDTKYDRAAALQQAQGLSVLQVFHDTPPWVWDGESDRGRIPRDLRDTWRFCRDIAARFQGTVQAWQPWNEGNAPNFGGHTVDELCSHQKAAFLGFKAGNPGVTVCWAPLGGINSEGLCRTIQRNHTQAYFDVYTHHSYDWNHDYPRLRQWAIQAASGKPVWVTECDRGMKADPASDLGDFTLENDRLKAAFVVQSIVSSLAAGASRHFHFILPWYMEQEGTIQFGLLRRDGSPRMGYVALAATGRLLAGGNYLGQWKDAEQPLAYVHLFRALPDGAARDVMVAWAEGPYDWPDRGKTQAALRLPADLEVESAWDYLGRPLDPVLPASLSGTPVFLVLPVGETACLSLHKNDLPAHPEAESPSSVVLQFRGPMDEIRGRVVEWTPEQDRIAVPGPHAWEVAVYNFGETAVHGEVRLAEMPEGWSCGTGSWKVAVEPMERQILGMDVQVGDVTPPSGETRYWLVFQGDFGEGNAAHLAVPFLHPEP